jgi:hypothetical protein
MILVSQQALKICINIAVKKERKKHTNISMVEGAGGTWQSKLESRAGRAWAAVLVEGAGPGGGRWRRGRLDSISCARRQAAWGPRRMVCGAMIVWRRPGAMHGGRQHEEEPGGGVEAAGCCSKLLLYNLFSPSLVDLEL